MAVLEIHQFKVDGRWSYDARTRFRACTAEILRSSYGWVDSAAQFQLDLNYSGISIGWDTKIISFFHENSSIQCIPVEVSSSVPVLFAICSRTGQCPFPIS